MDEKEIDYEQYFQILKQIYEDGLPFNRLLGMKVVDLDLDNVCMEIAFRDELIGNFMRGILHGGVISSVIDVVGGLTASVGLLKQIAQESLEEIEQRFARMGTIDLRVDYLRPGYGARFMCRGSILRTGNKVAVTRTEFKNEKDVLIAVGTGTYLVG
jgi:uncharacterized protein (TIGR00369 family)